MTEDTKYVIYKYFDGYRLTTEENHQAMISNARLYHKFDGFDTLSDVLEYIEKYFKINPKNIKYISNE